MASDSPLAAALHSVLDDIERTDPRVGSAALVAAGLLEVGAAIRDAAVTLAKPLADIAFEATAIRRKGVAQSLEVARERRTNGAAAAASPAATTGPAATPSHDA